MCMTSSAKLTDKKVQFSFRHAFFKFDVRFFRTTRHTDLKAAHGV